MLITVPTLSYSEQSIQEFLRDQGSSWIGGSIEAEFVWLHFMASDRAGMSDELAMAIGLRLGTWIDRADGVDTANCYFGLWDSRVAEVALGLEEPDT